MNRIKTLGHYVAIFLLVLVGTYILTFAVQFVLYFISGIAIPGTTFLVPLIAAFLTTKHFSKIEGRYPERSESRTLVLK